VSVFQDVPPGGVEMFGVFVSEAGRRSLVAEDRYVTPPFRLSVQIPKQLFSRGRGGGSTVRKEAREFRG